LIEGDTNRTVENNNILKLEAWQIEGLLSLIFICEKLILQ
jgi:hypothetical protein